MYIETSTDLIKESKKSMLSVDADYADDHVVLTNTPAEAESLLNS